MKWERALGPQRVTWSLTTSKISHAMMQGTRGGSWCPLAGGSQEVLKEAEGSSVSAGGTPGSCPMPSADPFTPRGLYTQLDPVKVSTKPFKTWQVGLNPSASVMIKSLHLAKPQFSHLLDENSNLHHTGRLNRILYVKHPSHNRNLMNPVILMGEGKNKA